MPNWVQRLLGAKQPTSGSSSIPPATSKKLQQALPSTLPKKRKPGESATGGCVPSGTLVQTVNGACRIEELRPGNEILSVDFGIGPTPIVTRVAKMHSYREATGILINGRYLVTPTHRLYNGQGDLMTAAELTAGMVILDDELKPERVVTLEQVAEYLEVFTLTTDHPSHNYMAGGLVCGNKAV